MPLRPDDLPADELFALLTADPDGLLDEEWYAAKDFIQRIGGRENALLAAAMLRTLEQPED